MYPSRQKIKPEFRPLLRKFLFQRKHTFGLPAKLTMALWPQSVKFLPRFRKLDNRTTLMREITKLLEYAGILV